MKKKYCTTIKQISLFFLILMIIFTTGCLSGQKASIIDSNEEMLEINIYSSDKVSLNTIDEFNKSSKVKINPTIININSQSDIDNYKTQLATSISAGEGPDIIYDYPETFPSLWKMINNGVFYDLNEIIKKDKEFDLSEYNSKIFDGGVIDGKRYFIPLYFKISLIWSSSSILSNNNLMISEDGWTWDDFSKLCTKYTGEKENGEKYFIGNSFNFESIMKNCWLDYIDYSKKEANFESKQFVDLLSNYKKIHMNILPDKKLKAPEIYFKYLKNNSLALVNGDNSMVYMWVNSSWISKVLNSEISCFLYPNDSNMTRINAQISKFAVINKSCKFKREAFNFIKLLLSEKYQNNGIDTKWAPVNLSAYHNIQNEYSSDNGNDKPIANFQSNEKNTYTSVALPDKTIRQLNSYYRNIESCSYVDSNIMNIINQEVEAYISGKQSVLQTSKIINNRVKIYMNE